MDSQPQIMSPLRNPLMSKTSIEEDKLLFKKPIEQDHTRSFTKLIIVSVLCVIFIAGQIVGGIIANSIAVISDAMHLITDFFGFILSFVFLYYSSKKSTNHKSFGFHRLEVVGALANLFIIWAVALFLFVESTTRIINKEFVQQPRVMLIVAVSGLCVNICMYFVLHSGGGHSHGLGQQCSHGHSHDHGHSNKVQKIPDFTIKVEFVNGVINDQKETDSVLVNGGEGQNQNTHQHNHENGECSHKHEGEKCTHEHQEHNHQGHDHDHHEHNHDHHDHKSHVHHDEHKHAQHSHNHDHNHGHGHGPGHDCHHHEEDHHHSDSPISMKAAILHAITDIIQSVGLVISSLIIFFVGSDHGNSVTSWNPWHLLDPVVTYVFSIMVVYSTWPITKLCYNIILEATPSNVHPEDIKSEFMQSKDVKGMHDFHLWQLKPGKLVLTAHVSADRGKERQVLRQLTKICRRNKIYHSTIQIERHDLLGKDGYIKCDNDID